MGNLLNRLDFRHYYLVLTGSYQIFALSVVPMSKRWIVC